MLIFLKAIAQTQKIKCKHSFAHVLFWKLNKTKQKFSIIMAINICFLGIPVALGCIYDAATHSRFGSCWRIMFCLTFIYLVIYALIITARSSEKTDGLFWILLVFLVYVLGLTMVVILLAIRGALLPNFQSYPKVEKNNEQPKLIRDDDECGPALLVPQVV